MSFPLRVDPDHGWHHAMNRGARRYEVFIDDVDRQLFVDLLRDVTEARGLNVAAYCLMGNHYHLVLNCPGGGLSSALRDLNSRYTRAFNDAHGFEGPLFRGRFKSVLIETDEQLLTTVRYVHRNPLDIQVHPEAHPWSSYPAYVNPSADRRVHWLDCSVPLALAGGPAEHRHSVETDRPSDETSILEAHEAPTPQPRRCADAANMKLVDGAVASVLGARPEGHRVGRQGSSDEARLAAIWLAVETGSVTTRAIAAHFALAGPGSVRSIAARARRKRESCPAFGALCDQVLAAL